MTSSLDALQTKLGVHFDNPSLLLRALTHRSYLNEHPDFPVDNERLEFLGDAVLGYITADVLFHRYPEMAEGELTRLRAALVRTEQLADLARRFDVGQHLRLGRGAAEGGGRERPSLLCDAFEAIIGALTIDGTITAARTFLEPLIGPLAERIIAAQTQVDSKSLLQEWAQAALGQTPIYHTTAESGPDHAKEFTVEVCIGDRRYGVGTGMSKQTAAQAAARAALAAAGVS